MTAEDVASSRYRAVRDFLGVAKWMADEVERDRGADLATYLSRLGRMLGHLNNIEQQHNIAKGAEDDEG